MFATFPSIASGLILSSCNQVAMPNNASAISILLGNSQAITPYFVPDAFALIFGSHATQDTSTLTIVKADLVGLTPSENNTAESLFAAILTSLLSGERTINFLKLTIDYWGYGYTANQRIDTLLIHFFKIAEYEGNLLSDSNYSNQLNPADY